MTAHYVSVEAATFGSLQDARCSFSAFVLCSILPRPPTSARIQCHHHSLSPRYLVCSDSHSWWWTAQVAACTRGRFLPGAVIYSFIALCFISVLTTTLNVYREKIWCRTQMSIRHGGSGFASPSVVTVWPRIGWLAESSAKVSWVQVWNSFFSKCSQRKCCSLPLTNIKFLTLNVTAS